MEDTSSDENDDCPDLISYADKRIPVTIITGYLGNCNISYDEGNGF